MVKGKFILQISVILAFALLTLGSANAQVDSLMRAGDSLYRDYRFDDAADALDQALEMAEDTSSTYDSLLVKSISERLLLAENGSNMARFVRTPKVLGKQMFALKDFHLFYPLEDKSWRRLPNKLDSDIFNPFVQSLYASDWSDRLYYSALDEDGTRSIFMTEIQDTLWSVPVRVEELSSPASNEIHPMLSPDGKTLYFSSDGLYGLGGYDLYVSSWDEDKKCWSMPQNMGVPFSSPDDDFLYIDSEDEKYSVFASTRDCPTDSTWIYVLEYERTPLHVSIEDPDELYALSRLDPFKKKKKEEAKPAKQPDDLTMVYMAQMDQVRELRDSIAAVMSHLDELRTELAFSHDEEERYELSSTIIEVEKVIPALQKDLETAQAQLQKTEYEFLRKGVFINPNISEEEKEEDAVNDFVAYEFVKRTYGDALELNFMVPEVKFDYTFQVLPEAVFAEDQSLPAGIVYQIQLFGGRKASLPELKGLSPIYEHRSPSGMYIYRVGRFFTYDEALNNVMKVRSLGFKSAYICAFENGEQVSVAKARTLQERLKGGFALYEIYLIPDSGELDPAVAETVASSAVGKDIIRTESEDGTQVFSVGPFDSKEAADSLVAALKDVLVGKVVCEPVN